MTKRKALQVLIEHAARDCVGAGVGIRSNPKEEQILLVAQAVCKVHKEAYGVDADKNDLFNLGLPSILIE
jgi:hypothetical protein